MFLEKSIKPIFEFLLWDNCNNNCQFCFLKRSPRVFSLTEQQNISSHVLKFINSPRFKKKSHILLVGGELFDDYRRTFLIDLFQAINIEIANEIVDNFYLNTNLIYNEKCMTLLQNCLSCLDKHIVSTKLHFTTSYDICGRFSCQSKIDAFFTNIKQLKENFPMMTLNVNAILTKQMCIALLDKSFDILQFETDYNVNLNFLPYIISNDELTPDRDLVLKSISMICGEYPDIRDRLISNTLLNQPRMMYYYKNGIWNYCSCKNSKCGHSQNFKLYDKEKKHCFACDLELFLKNAGFE